MRNDASRDVDAADVEQVPVIKRRWEAPAFDVTPLAGAKGTGGLTSDDDLSS